jgi:hypothetical protein
MKLSRAYAKVTNREGGSHIRALIKVLAAAIALAMSTGTAFAIMSKTTTERFGRRPLRKLTSFSIFPKARW